MYRGNLSKDISSAADKSGQFEIEDTTSTPKRCILSEIFVIDLDNSYYLTLKFIRSNTYYL